MFDFDRLRYLERGMRLRWDTDEGAAVEKEVLKRFVVAVVVIVVVVVLSVVGLKVFYTSISGWQRSSAGL